MAAHPIDGKNAAFGVSGGKGALARGGLGARRYSMRPVSSPCSCAAYQRASGVGEKAASAFATRAVSSAWFCSSPSPKLPEGEPGGRKYAKKRAWLRTHSFWERSMPVAPLITYHASRLLAASHSPCVVPLPKPPSPLPQGLVHTTAIG